METVAPEHAGGRAAAGQYGEDVTDLAWLTSTWAEYLSELAEDPLPSPGKKPMDIELDPPHGITGFPLGMPAEEVKRAAAALGTVKVSNEGSTARFSPMTVLVLHQQFEIVFHLPGNTSLVAAEVWIPREGPEEIAVRFRGMDVFRTPALQLLDRLEAMGLTVIRRGSYSFVPRLSLGFTRVAGHEVPLDTDERPLYFQAVLVGPTDYYDSMLDGPGAC